MTHYQVDWDTINNLPFSETCEWLNISIGQNHFIQCPSPFHKDKKPSCHIIEDRTCYCFSCGFSANSLGLIRTVLDCSKQKALQFVNNYVKVLTPLEENLVSEIRLEPWELACLGLKKNPLLQQTVRIPEQNETPVSLHFQPEDLLALEIINDKFLENCITEKSFLERYAVHVANTFSYLMKNSNAEYKDPNLELWKYSTQKDFQKALKKFEEQRNYYMKKNTGLNFSVLQEWHMNEKDNQVSQIIKRRGKDIYKEFVKKMDAVVSILEQNENNVEETQNDRKVQSTVVR